MSHENSWNHVVVQGTPCTQNNANVILPVFIVDQQQNK